MRKIITQDVIMAAILPKVQNGCSYLEAVLDYTERNGIELESVGEVIKRSQILKEKIKLEAIELLLVKKE